MSERGLSQSEENTEEQPEVQETRGTEATQETTASRELEQATFEPGALVEETLTVEQAEVIESALTNVVETEQVEQVQRDSAPESTAGFSEREDEPGGNEATPINLPGSETAQENVGATPQPIPQPVEEVSATPINLPGSETAQENVVATPQPIPQPVEEVSATPINLPGSETAQENVVATPQPIDEVAATPIILPGQEQEAADSTTDPIYGAMEALLQQAFDQKEDMVANRTEANEQKYAQGQAAIEAKKEEAEEKAEAAKDELWSSVVASFAQPVGIVVTGTSGETSNDEPEGENVRVEDQEMFTATLGPEDEMVETVPTLGQEDQQLEETLPIEEIEEIDTGLQVEMETSPEGVVEQPELNEDALEGVEEYWEPPEMYVHYASDGTKTVVGPDGKPLDNPPIINIIVDASGKEIVRAYYPGMKQETQFEIESYSPPIQEGLYVYTDSAGKCVVVDGAGKPVDSPPIIQMVAGDGGQEVYRAYYPDTKLEDKVVLGQYSGTFEQEMFVHVDPSGKMTVVGSDGKPIDSPPYLTKVIGPTGQEIIRAEYPGAGETLKTELSFYTAPLDSCFAHFGSDGKVTVVDANGKPVDSPPLINKILDASGQEQIIASYPGTGQESKIILGAYKPESTEETFISVGKDGKPVVVDAAGVPIDSPPIVQMVMGETGTPIYKTSYPGTDIKSELSLYSAPLDDCSISVAQDGTYTVVDGSGKPLPSQPVLTKLIGPAGQEIIRAWYPTGSGTGAKVELGFYKPPSGHLNSTSV